MLPLQEEFCPAWRPISPHREMGAYEALWLRPGATFKSLAGKFNTDAAPLPSELVPPSEAEKTYREARNLLHEDGIERFGIRIHGASDYPANLRDAREPIELLYYQGIWEYILTRRISAVGTRRPTDQGVAKTRELARFLVENDFTVVSGLAAGIDTAAHETAIEAGGRTIAVIGTPLNTVYPRTNNELQRRIAAQHLLISPIPVLRYSRQAPPQNRLFFPERNKVMSALTEATIIVEAGETSGTRTQARAALQQGRKLFLLDNLLRNRDLTWPAQLIKQGAIRIRDFGEILQHVN